MHEAITPLLITLDEMPNLERTFAALSWARSIVVVDSGSTDGTREWLDSDARVRVLTRAFDDHTNQWRYGLDSGSIETEWVLALDADHVMSHALIEELGRLSPAPKVGGFLARFVYCIEGHPLRSSLYPSRMVLARRETARFEQDGHTQRLTCGGSVERLTAPILHDDRKPRARWLSEQARYAAAEAGKLLTAQPAELPAADRLRRLGWVAPWLVPLWCLLMKGGLLDGRAGWVYAGERAVAEWLLALELWSRRMAQRAPTGKGRSL